MSGVHQFVRIGAHAMLGGASALVRDVPPFVIAASDKNGNKATPHGINVEGLRRRGFDAGQIAALRQAYKLLYKSDPGFDEARNEISALLGQTDVATGAPLRAFVEFLAATQRAASSAKAAPHMIHAAVQADLPAVARAHVNKRGTIAMVAGRGLRRPAGVASRSGLHARLGESVDFAGIGGRRMMAQGFVSHWPMETLSVNGYVVGARSLQGNPGDAPGDSRQAAGQSAAVFHRRRRARLQFRAGSTPCAARASRSCISSACRSGPGAAGAFAPLRARWIASSACSRSSPRFTPGPVSRRPTSVIRWPM